MFSKRLILTLCAFAAILPLVGCRHKCCHKESVSSAACCPAPGAPVYLPPPGQ